MTHHPERRLSLIKSDENSGVALRVAIATRSNCSADEVFGRAPLFAIYEIATDHIHLAEVIEFALLPRKCGADNDNPDGCEERVGARIASLAGCHVVFARRIGDVAAAAAMKAHIHPIELGREETINALLGRCQIMLATNPPPWLRRAMSGADDPESAGEEVAERIGTEFSDDVHPGALPTGGTASAFAG